jgi:hypothetical protein
MIMMMLIQVLRLVGNWHGVLWWALLIQVLRWYPLGDDRHCGLMRLVGNWHCVLWLDSNWHCGLWLGDN